MLKHTMKQLGGVEEIRSSDGIRYEIRYLANDEEVKKYMPSVGDPAEWTDRDNAYVTRITKTCYAPGMWTILIQAEVIELEDDLASLGINIAGLDSVTEQTYDIGTINFLPEWFGCRQASQGDCTQFSETGVGPIPSGRLKYKRLDGEWANPGDYIARNAVPLYFSPDNDRLVQNATAGSMTFDRSDPDLPLCFLHPAEYQPHLRIPRCQRSVRRQMRTRQDRTRCVESTDAIHPLCGRLQRQCVRQSGTHHAGSARGNALGPRKKRRCLDLVKYREKKDV